MSDRRGAEPRVQADEEDPAAWINVIGKSSRHRFQLSSGHRRLQRLVRRQAPILSLPLPDRRSPTTRRRPLPEGLARSAGVSVTLAVNGSDVPTVRPTSITATPPNPPNASNADMLSSTHPRTCLTSAAAETASPMLRLKPDLERTRPGDPVRQPAR